ncbi:MAG: hypothetical protein Q7R52_02685 [archaeon]|nr:hypothetical protein [archaeon]
MKIEEKINNFRKELSKKLDNNEINNFQQCKLWNDFVDSLNGEFIYKFEMVMVKDENNVKIPLSKTYINENSKLMQLPDINFRIGNLLFDQAKKYIDSSYLNKEEDLKLVMSFLKTKYKNVYDEIFIENIELKNGNGE